jgi:hypothetical protein
MRFGLTHLRQPESPGATVGRGVNLTEMDEEFIKVLAQKHVILGVQIPEN